MIVNNDKNHDEIMAADQSSESVPSPAWPGAWDAPPLPLVPSSSFPPQSYLPRPVYYINTVRCKVPVRAYRVHVHEGTVAAYSAVLYRTTVVLYTEHCTCDTTIHVHIGRPRPVVQSRPTAGSICHAPMPQALQGICVTVTPSPSSCLQDYNVRVHMQYE